MSVSTPILYQISGTNPASTQTFAVELDSDIQPAVFQFVIYEALSELVINHNVSVSNVVTIDQGYNNKYIVDLPIPGELCSNDMYVIVSVINDNTSGTSITPFSDPVLIVGPPLTPTISHVYRTDVSNNLDIYLDVSFVCSVANRMNIAVQYTDLSDEVHFDMYSDLTISIVPLEGIDYYRCTVIDASGGALPLLTQGHISAQQVTLFGDESEFSSTSRFGNTVEVDTIPLPPISASAYYDCQGAGSEEILTFVSWVPNNEFNDQYFTTIGYDVYVYSDGSLVDTVDVSGADTIGLSYNQSIIPGISPGDMITFTVATRAINNDHDPGYTVETSDPTAPTEEYMYVQPAGAPTGFSGNADPYTLTIDLTWTPGPDNCGGLTDNAYFEITCDVSGVGPFTDISYSDTSFTVTGLSNDASYSFIITPYTGSEYCGLKEGGQASCGPIQMLFIPSGPATDLSYNLDVYELSADISWNAPIAPIEFGTGDFVEYQVYVSSSNVSYVESVTSTSTTLTNLDTNTPYIVYVVVVTEDSAGALYFSEPSVPVNFSLDTINPDSVTNLDASLNVYGLSALISWDAPSSVGTGHLFGYNVYVDSSLVFVEEPYTSILLSNLTLDISHNVQVVVVTKDSAGDRYYSDPNPYIDFTLVTVPSNSVTDLDVSLNNYYLSATFTWDAPSIIGTGHLFGYQLVVNDVSNSFIYAPTTTITLTGLSVNTPYSAYVVVVTKDSANTQYESAKSNEVDYEIATGSSGPPTNLNAVTDVSYGFAYALSGFFTWQNPEDTGQFDPNYFVVNIPGTDVNNIHVTYNTSNEFGSANSYSVPVPQSAYDYLSQNTQYIATVYLVTNTIQEPYNGEPATTLPTQIDTTVINASPPTQYSADVSLNTLTADISWNWTSSLNGNLEPDHFIVTWTNTTTLAEDGSYNVPYVSGQSSYDVTTGQLIANTDYGVNIYLVTVNEQGTEFSTVPSLNTFTFDTDRPGASAPVNLTAVAGYQNAYISWTAPSFPSYATPTTYTMVMTSPSSSPVTTTYPYNGAAPVVNQQITGLTNETTYTFTVSLTVSTSAGTIAGTTATATAIPTGYPVFVGVPDISNNVITATVWSNTSTGNMGDFSNVVLKFSNSTASVATFGPGSSTAQFPVTNWTDISENAGTPGSIFQIGTNTGSAGSVNIVKSTDVAESPIALNSKKYIITITPILPEGATSFHALISVSNPAGITSSPTTGF